MDSDEPKKRSGFRYRGSLVGPAILITIGIIFLLNNLGYITGSAWEIILNLWPVILIAIGLDNLLQGRGIAGAALFIGLGVIFLLSNFGWVGWDIWSLIIRLWPLLLIAIGLDILIGRRSFWGAVLALVLILSILAAALWYFSAGPAGAVDEETAVTQQLEGATEAEIVLRPSVGNVRIESFSSSDILIDGVIHQWRGETIQRDFQVDENIGKLSILSESNGFFYPTPLTSDMAWVLSINNDTPVSIDMSLGVGEINADLSGAEINKFKLDNAVGSLIIFLPSEGRISGEIENAIGKITIFVPVDTALRLRAETGLTNIQVPANYVKENSTYTSPDYETSGNRVDLLLNQAIGLVEVRTDRIER